jgi:hypothetical protein
MAFRQYLAFEMIGENPYKAIGLEADFDVDCLPVVPAQC